MYLHLGEETVIRDKNIIGIFDLDNTTVMKSTRNYLRKATEEARVQTVSYELPKSFIVTDEKTYSVYISQLMPATLEKRIKEKNEEILCKQTADKLQKIKDGAKRLSEQITIK